MPGSQRPRTTGRGFGGIGDSLHYPQPSGATQFFRSAVPATAQNPRGPKSSDHGRDALQQIEVEGPVVLPVAMQVARAEVDPALAYRSKVFPLESSSYHFVTAVVSRRLPRTYVRSATDSRAC